MRDLATLAELLDYTSTTDYNVISLGTFVDKKSENATIGNLTSVQEFVYNGERDREEVDVQMRVGKIYDAFLYGRNSYWKEIILNQFERSTEIDFMLLVSFAYMINTNDNKEDRELSTCAEIAYVLSKFAGVNTGISIVQQETNDTNLY